MKHPETAVMNIEEARKLIAEHGDLRAAVRHYQGQLIAAALEANEGKVTLAARELGTSHQNLANIIDGRQELKELRRPAAPRHKSVFKIPVESAPLVRKAT